MKNARFISKSLRKELNSERVYFVRGEDKGRPAWYYVLLVEDEETERKFEEAMQVNNDGDNMINLEHYGKILKSGYGQQPPNYIKEWIKENYGRL